MSPANPLPGTIASALVLALSAGDALAQEYTLRIQTHHTADNVSGQLATQFVEDVETMSGGRVDIELFYSSAVVKTVETFDAAATGILDGDLTNGNYQVGKNPAFQFVSDIMGGYETPWQMYAWYYYGGGQEMANELYNQYNMQLIGWWIYGQESLASSKPLTGPRDLEGWKFRSPPGLETEIFR
jgi:TRAP-type mannitol/chloroaromatic compound transport system substrate-binding protein